MRHRFLGLGVAAALVLALPATSFASKIDVFPGDSIQRAVRQAHHGDVIKVHEGVYRQSVQIRKNGLTLKGAGADWQDGTVIKPKKTKRCQGGSSGVCILGHKKGDHRVRTENTTVKGFDIRDFRAFGAIATHTKNTRFVRNKFAGNGEYGVAAFDSKGTELMDNYARRSDEAGFYVGDSKRAEAVLRENIARANGQFGFFLRDSSHGVVRENKAILNCMGVGLVDTGAPNAVSKWLVRSNDTTINRRLCEGEGGGPTISGTGIGVLGARRSEIRDNKVFSNKPKRRGPPAPFAGGIAVMATTGFGGGPAGHNSIVGNRAAFNLPADIVWDGQGEGNRFARNRCETSQPAGLCR